jgi:hypothetical protein
MNVLEARLCRARHFGIPRVWKVEALRAGYVLPDKQYDLDIIFASY